MESKNSNDNVCVVCFRNISIYAVGNCDHYDRVCFICSARLRVLCQKNDCPICRKVLPRVIFTRQKQPYSILSRQPYSHTDHKHHITFEDESVEDEYRLLLQHQCPICVQVTVFQSFGHLKDHTRKIHERFSCDLCVEHLKLFTFERKYYTRKDLAQHRRNGDADDTSHRGHPRCQFCDDRYIDKDELFRHLRRDHFYCHFCDAEGSYQFYGDYELLRAHFRDEHFLCSEGECINEKFTSVFRSEIEIKAHIAAQHSKNYTKQQAKQARTLEVEFTITPRSQYEDFDESSRRGGGGRKGPRNGASGSRNRYRYPEEDIPMETLETTDVDQIVSYHIDPNSAVDFPSLGNNGGSNQGSEPLRKPPPRNYREFNAMDEESFPSLGGGNVRPMASNTVHLKIYNQEKNNANKGANLSIKLSSNRPQPDSLSVASVVSSSGNLQQKKVANSKPRNEISGGWFGNGFTAATNDFPSLQIQPTKKSTLSWNPNESRETVTNSVWLKKSEPLTEKNKMEDDEFTVVLSKDKKKKQKNLTNQNTNGLLKSPDKKVQPEKDEKVRKEKEPSPLKETARHEETPSPVKEKAKKKTELNFKQDVVTPQTLTSVKTLAIEEFPPLMVNEISKPAPIPPGFNVKKKLSTEPPPGFNKAVTNGNSSSTNGNNNANFTLSSLARQLAVSTNLSSSSSAEVSPDFCYTPTYIEPDNYQTRNRNLIDEVMRLLEHDQQKFEEFKSYSGKFRQGLIEAEDYYQQCVQIFGKEKFKKVLNELLVLLPDISKQRNLLNVHNKYLNSTKRQNSGAVPKNRDNNFLVCASCQQVLTNLDFRTHMICHEVSD